MEKGTCNNGWHLKEGKRLNIQEKEMKGRVNGKEREGRKKGNKEKVKTEIS